MGAQRLLWQASQHDALGDAIADCAYSIAFGRWAQGSVHPSSELAIIRWRGCTCMGLHGG